MLNPVIIVILMSHPWPQLAESDPSYLQCDLTEEWNTGDLTEECNTGDLTERECYTGNLTEENVTQAI